MTNKTIFFVFSFMEWFSLVTLSLSIFRFSFRDMWGQIVGISIGMAVLSQSVFHLVQVPILATLLQPPVLFLFYRMVLHMHWYYSTFITVFGYMLYLCIQYGVFLIFKAIGIQITPLTLGTLSAYLLQGVTIVAVLALARFVCVRQWGYTFVPDHEECRVKMTETNVNLLVLSLIGYITLGASNYMVYNGWSAVLWFMTSFTLGLLLYAATRKEKDSIRGNS